MKSRIDTVSRIGGRTVFAGAVSVIALCSSGAAWAQDAAPAPASDSGIQDIIVTAQRREQRLQDIPVAVTAINPNTLQANRIQTTIDLTGAVPGLLARQNTGGQGSPSYAMRGVSSSSSAASQDREVSQYLDGVYMGGTRGVVFDIADIERIEVLRGPQGTLFGRNATAGAISIITRDPDGVFGFRQDLTFGNQAQLRLRTTINTPQIGPFSGYVTYLHDENRGDVRNLGYRTCFDRSSGFQDFVGRQCSPKYLGGKNNESVFAAVKFEPGDGAFKAVYKFDWEDGQNWQEARAITALNTSSVIGKLIGDILAAQPEGGGIYGPTSLNPSDQRPDAVNNAWTQKGFLKSQGHNLTSTLQVSDSLSFKNITAYRKGESYGPATIAGLGGLEFTPGAFAAYSVFAAQSGTASILAANGILPGSPAFGPAYAATYPLVLAGVKAKFAPAIGQYFSVYDGNNHGTSSQWSTEFQANVTNTLFDLVLGGLYYHAKEDSGSVPGMVANYAFTPLPELLPLGNPFNSHVKTRSIAGYAQADIHVTPQLDLQLGGRYTSDRKDTLYTSGGDLVGTRENGTITPTVYVPQVFKSNKFTYSVALNYKVTPDILIYAKRATGFLSGGSVGSLNFEPETVTSHEVGIKSELLDRHLILNLTGWQAKYKNLQTANSGSTVGHPELGVVVVTAGTAKAYGLEFEMTARLTDGLTIGGQMGYTHTELTDVNPVLLLAQSRYQFANIPKLAGGGYAQYITQPIWDTATVMFRLDANYQGKSNALTDPDIETNNPAFAPYKDNPARVILNGRIAIRDMPMGGSARAELALWGKNLTNNRDMLFGFPFGTYLYSDSYQRARSYGVDVSVKY